MGEKTIASRSPRLWKYFAGIAALVASLLAGVHACYQPDFTTAIYECDVYRCPSGQVCNSDKVCVYYPVDGCTNGGIGAGNDVYLCPGTTNRCAPNFAVCSPTPTGLACPPATKPDLGLPPACLVCCPS